ncbi:CCR4-NOT transcription complex subunit 10 [Trachymyrmex septentrionalis]|uniref:CCR4-NOT transcription complex subunit 10 n=1 Tax=Trachymyrmex septentrionalis TaxID=34720 RepID=A0A195ETL3_9HYME|nr:CCR4-NOT transcription complex subunit 10 [Trachymyrmex septentrionalis]
MSEISESQSKDSVSVITEQERELAQNILSEFQKGAYASCLSYLNKLESLRPTDLKVTHNKVVVEYYKSDLKKTELTRKSLNAICGQISTMDSNEAIDDVEKCVMRYNQAVLLYHTKQYNAALQIMTRLFAFIEPMEETLAHKVCLLLIELYIVTEQPDAALSILNYVESQFISTDNSKISSSIDKDGVIKSIKEQREQKKDVDIVIDAFKIKLLKYKARIYLLTHQLKLCKKEWKTLVSLGIVNTSTIFLKAHLEYLRGNYEKAIQFLNSNMKETDFKLCGESSAVLFYNNMACLHLAMGKPTLACTCLQKALRANKFALESMQVKDADPLSSQPLYTLGGNKHYELMYSLGVTLLYAGKASKAFDCFTEVAQKIHNNPKLLLRMAECCIYSYKYSNKVDFNIPKRRKDLVQKIIGSGIHKKIILATSLSKDIKYHSEGLSYAIPQPTLEFGYLCLKNALLLLPNNNEPSVPGSLATTMANSVSLSLTSGHNLGIQHTTLMSRATAIESFNLKISILAASAYVSLCLGDYILSLEHAKTLLSFNKLPGAYKMLGNLYAAESLIFMDKINEALEYLKLENLQDLNTSISTPEIQEKDKEKMEEVMIKPIKAWYPTTVSTGTAIIRYNLAVAYAIRGELDKSGETLKQIWMSKEPDCDIPIQVIMLALYIELQLGLRSLRRGTESFRFLTIRRANFVLHGHICGQSNLTYILLCYWRTDPMRVVCEYTLRALARSRLVKFAISQNLEEQINNLLSSPPRMKKSETKDSISSVDSDVSLSFDRRGSKSDEADLSDYDSEIRIVKKSDTDQDSGADSLDDVRQAIAKRPEWASIEEYAMVEFTDSASARIAIQMALGDVQVFELRHSVDKKKKHQPTKKCIPNRTVREDNHNSSSCPSGSEPEDGRVRLKRGFQGYPMYHVHNTSYPFQAGMPSSDACLSRKLSSCSISSSENGFMFRRLSSCSGSSSDSGRRYSTCSSGSETAFLHPSYSKSFYHHENHRYSCCPSTGPPMECRGICYIANRRGSADCGPLSRRLSTYSRDFDMNIRRSSLCSSNSEQNVFYRSRSNNSIAMTHVPENVTRMPSGPDGTRGFFIRSARISTPLEPAH